MTQPSAEEYEPLSADELERVRYQVSGVDHRGTRAGERATIVCARIVVIEYAALKAALRDEQEHYGAAIRRGDDALDQRDAAMRDLAEAREQLAMVRQERDALETECAAFARACGPICEGEPERPSDPYLDVELFDVDALLDLKLTRETRLAKEQAAAYERSESDQHETATSDRDPLHPTGRCSCAGERRCEWCLTHCDECGVTLPCAVHQRIGGEGSLPNDRHTFTGKPAEAADANLPPGWQWDDEEPGDGDDRTRLHVATRRGVWPERESGDWCFGWDYKLRGRAQTMLQAMCAALGIVLRASRIEPGRIVGDYGQDWLEQVSADDIEQCARAALEAFHAKHVSSLSELPTTEPRAAASTGEHECGWTECAAQMSRNSDYYQGLVTRIGQALGDEAYIADDGTRADCVLRAKVPELVEQRIARLAELERSARELCDRWRGSAAALRREVANGVALRQSAEAKEARADVLSSNADSLSALLRVESGTGGSDGK